jgi:hypothetical protein
VFPFKYNTVNHHQCTYEKLPNATMPKEKWCCTNGDCDANLEWGLCPESNELSPDSVNCTEGFTSVDQGRNCYKVYAGSDALRTWDDARKQCEKVDKAELVSVVDPFEQSYVYLLTFVKTLQSSWLGIKNKGGSTWSWTDANSMDFENWENETDKASTEGQCVYMKVKSKTIFKKIQVNRIHNTDDFCFEYIRDKAVSGSLRLAMTRELSSARFRKTRRVRASLTPILLE